MNAEKLVRERILKTLLSGLGGAQVEDESGIRDLLQGFLSKAGKGKDELLQILGREIGIALAAVLAKPLEQMAENRRVRITIELVPKSESQSKASGRTKRTVKKNGRPQSKAQ